ncbi:hypothetical protein [Nostoc sp. CHAB 5836]|uniref:hypothetical protein n=1 Tax=Nostoc sp. CHAB 5836 TaxID=2780404 RepID=UPI001E5ADD9C|nr:hypothetical protein [Nostoc sp. CHAB 5836]
MEKRNVGEAFPKGSNCQVLGLLHYYRRIWLLIKSCSALARMSSGPADALAIASIAQL